MKSGKKKSEQWGVSLSHIIYNADDPSKKVSQESVDRILDKFVDAVEAEGLVTGGGCSPIRLDVVTCEICRKNIVEDIDDLCPECLDKIAKEHGYIKKGENKSGPARE